MANRSPNSNSPQTAAGVRFAPSPTGHFHIGNLRSAWVSWWWAKHLGLPWVVRFEDIDEPRNAPGALESQLRDLRALGLEPDTIVVQSRNRPRHLELFLRAVQAGKVYPCYCSRKEVRDAIEGLASAPHIITTVDDPIYNGRCRHRTDRPKVVAPTLGWRFRGPDQSGIHDFIVARTSPELDASGLPDPGSFVPAYNWACAIDDYDGRYPLLVRAADLGHVVFQQRWIQGLLAEQEGVQHTPAVFHSALVVQNDGTRLEKRTQGVTLAEVLAAGLSAGDVTTRFERSFDPEDRARQIKHPSELGDAILGEKVSAITLSQLGI